MFFLWSRAWSAGRQNICFFYGQMDGQTDGQQHGQKMVVLKTDGQTYGQEMVVLIFDGVKGGPP